MIFEIVTTLHLIKTYYLKYFTIIPMSNFVKPTKSLINLFLVCTTLLNFALLLL